MADIVTAPRRLKDKDKIIKRLTKLLSRLKADIKSCTICRLPRLSSECAIRCDGCDKMVCQKCSNCTRVEIPDKTGPDRNDIYNGRSTDWKFCSTRCFGKYFDLEQVANYDAHVGTTAEEETNKEKRVVRPRPHADNDDLKEPPSKRTKTETFVEETPSPVLEKIKQMTTDPHKQADLQEILQLCKKQPAPTYRQLQIDFCRTADRTDGRLRLLLGYLNAECCVYEWEDRFYCI